MLSFGAPLWLTGLAALPLIRWLHRGGRHRRAVPVSHLGLWRRAGASAPAAGERQPPDPAWRRRALLAALVLVALAEPQQTAPGRRITLWVDDSLSMLTREARGTRLVEGLTQARALLDAIPGADVEVRALGDPWRKLGAPDEATVAAVATGAGRSEPQPPPAPLLRRDRRHWLITDGTDASLLQWPGSGRPERVIQVAGVERNAGLERLSARRNPNDPGQIDLLLKLVNGGSAVETRDVIFTTDAGVVTRSTQRVEATSSTLVALSVPASALASATVRATLQPGDALAEDDTIVLDLAPLRRRRVAHDPGCPAALLAAVATHPALALAAADATDVQAALDCGRRGADRPVATVRMLGDHAPTPARGPVQWSASVPGPQRIGLDTERLQRVARLQARPTDAVLLALDGEPVIVRRAGAPVVLETALDFGSPGIARGPEIPLLVNLMFEQLLGRRLLDPIAITDRGPGSTTVVPTLQVGTGAIASVADEPHAVRDGVRPLLAVAMLVLLWEIAALVRQWLRLRTVAGAGSG